MQDGDNGLNFDVFSDIVGVSDKDLYFLFFLFFKFIQVQTFIDIGVHCFSKSELDEGV